jgi:hypothetical protein
VRTLHGLRVVYGGESLPLARIYDMRESAAIRMPLGLLEAEKGLVKQIEQYRATELSRVACPGMEQRWRQERIRELADLGSDRILDES